MQERQMPLIRHPSIQEELRRRFQLDVSEVKSVSVLRGMGFIEPSSGKASPIVRSEHLLGEWCPISAWEIQDRSEWIRVPKSEWLSPLTPDEFVALDPDPQESGGFGLYQSQRQPSQRVFVVHADWPKPRAEALVG